MQSELEPEQQPLKCSSKLELGQQHMEQQRPIQRGDQLQQNLSNQPTEPDNVNRDTIQIQEEDDHGSSSEDSKLGRVGRLGRRIVTPKKLRDFVCSLYNIN